MILPYTASNLALWLDPSERFVNKDQNGNVLSVINRVNGKPIIQSNPAFQPVWNPTSFNGTPGLAFSGSQYLSYNELGPICAGVRKPITVIQAVLQPLAGLGIPFSIGQSTSGGLVSFLSLFTTAGGNGFAVDYFDDTVAGATNLFTSNTVINNPFVYTSTYYPDRVSLRINGVDIATVANTGGQLTSDNCSIGTLVKGSGPFFPFNGTIGTTLVYLGSNGSIDAEKAVMKSCNLIT